MTCLRKSCRSPELWPIGIIYPRSSEEPDSWVHPASCVSCADVHLSKDIKFGSKWYECMWSSSHFIQLFPRRSRRARNTRHPSPPMRKMTPTRIAVTCTCDLSRAFGFHVWIFEFGSSVARHEGKLRQCFLARLNYLFIVIWIPEIEKGWLVGSKGWLSEGMCRMWMIRTG